MKYILEKLINNELSKSEIDSLKQSLKFKDKEELENISFLKKYIELNNFDMPLIPDTAKSELFSSLSKKIVISTSSFLSVLLILGITMFLSYKKEDIKTKTSEIDKNLNHLILDTQLESNDDKLTQKKHLKTKTNEIDKNHKNLRIEHNNIRENNTSNDIDPVRINLSNQNNLTQIKLLHKNISDHCFKDIKHYKNKIITENEKRFTLSINRLTDINHYPGRENLNLQSFNNLNISIAYDINNFVVGFSIRRENFNLNYKENYDDIDFNISEYPNITSGILSIAYKVNVGDLSPFFRIEYGLNRRGHVFGANLGLQYEIFNNLNINTSLSNSNLITYENADSYKFRLHYGLSFNF